MNRKTTIISCVTGKIKALSYKFQETLKRLFARVFNQSLIFTRGSKLSILRKFKRRLISEAIFIREKGSTGICIFRPYANMIN